MHYIFIVMMWVRKVGKTRHKKAHNLLKGFSRLRLEYRWLSFIFVVEAWPWANQCRVRSVGQYKSVTEPKSGVCLLVATKAKLVQQEVLFGCGPIWENGGLPVSKPVFSAGPRQSPTFLSKTKTEVRAQSSCSILKCHPLEHASGC